MIWLFLKDTFDSPVKSMNYAIILNNRSEEMTVYFIYAGMHHITKNDTVPHNFVENHDNLHTLYIHTNNLYSIKDIA